MSGVRVLVGAKNGTISLGRLPADSDTTDTKALSGARHHYFRRGLAGSLLSPSVWYNQYPKQ